MIGYNLHKCGGVLGDNVLKRLGAEAGASGHMAACASELSWGSATTITTSAQCYGRSGSGTSCESGWGGTGFALDLRSGSGSVWLPWLAISRPRPPLRVFYIYIDFFFFLGCALLFSIAFSCCFFY